MHSRLFAPLGFFLIFSAIFLGCSPRHSNIVLVQLGKESISLEEYENSYHRHSGSWDAARQTTQEDREKFLDLLTKYRLKLLDVYARNLLKEPDVLSELSEYRANLATSFMLERELTEPAIRKMYDRRKEEIRSSHILLRLSTSPSPEETLKVYNRTLEIIQALRQGANFSSLADSFSEDPSAKTNYGDLYYFSSGQMVTPFEDACYSMKVGEITPAPVRTNFGYHVIKLMERKPAVASIRVRHIMMAHKQGDTTGVDSALIKILLVRDSLRAGGDFAELAMNHSEDPGSSARGGDLGTFSRRRFVQNFEEVAFKLKAGEISDTVRTAFGYHLIKCEEVNQLQSYEEMRSELLKLFQQHRYNDEHRKFVDGFKNKLGYQVDNDVLNEFIPYVDSTLVPSDSGWVGNLPSALRAKVMLRVGQLAFKVDSVVEMFGSRADFRTAVLIPAKIPEHVDRLGDFIVLELASIGLEDRYPQFKHLMKEFQDGVVLYKGEQMEVWNKISVTDEKLRAYFEERRSQFTFPDRIELVEVIAPTESLATLAYRNLKGGMNIDSVVARLSNTPGVRKNHRALQPVSTDELTQQAWSHTDGSIVGPIEHKSQYVVAQVLKKEAQRQKSFEEAGAELSTAFQDYESKRLEQEWIDRLRAQYPVVQHKELLPKAFTGVSPSEN